MASAFARSARVGAAAAALVVLVLAPSVARGDAGRPSVAERARLDSARAWMQREQRVDGTLPSTGTWAEYRSAATWGVLGLAAAGVNARDQAAVGGRALFKIVESQAHLVSETVEAARFLLAAHAVDVDPHAVGGVDLVGAIAAAARPDGGMAARVGSQVTEAAPSAWAALALGTVGEPVAQAFANGVLDWLVRTQRSDGSWPSGPVGGPGDTETTALVLEALAANARTVRQADTVAQARALQWLQQQQNADGGLSPAADGSLSDTFATAGTVRALAALRIDPGTLTRDGQSPLQFLAAAQETAARGRIGLRPGVPGIEPSRTTGYGMLAFARLALPVGPVARGTGPGSIPPQVPPKGLPIGPLRPIVVEVTVPAAPAPAPDPPPVTTTTPVPPPVIARPLTPPATAGDGGVRRIPTPKPTKQERGDGSGAGVGAGSGSGSGGGGGGTGGGGSVSTPGAPDRAGGGGGTATGPVSAPAAAAGAGAPLRTRRGGTPVKTGREAPRVVSGTIIGRQSPTEGAAGSAVAAPGTPGSQSGGDDTTPWWAIGLGLLLAVGVATGIFLDRRRPELAL
jgi:prenyltransferase beta subunit